MNKFYKVSLEEWKKCGGNEEDWNDIELPKRGSKHSAGYDIHVPFDVTVGVGETVKFFSGIKCELDCDKFLAVYVRSSVGIKRHLRLPNAVAIVDADFANNPDNEGNIMIALYNFGDKTVTLEKGERVVQGVITPYYTVEGDSCDNEDIGVRTGGIGSSGL